MPTANAALIERAYTELRRGLEERLIENAYPHFYAASAALGEAIGSDEAFTINRQVVGEKTKGGVSLNDDAKQEMADEIHALLERVGKASCREEELTIDMYAAKKEAETLRRQYHDLCHQFQRLFGEDAWESYKPKKFRKTT